MRYRLRIGNLTLIVEANWWRKAKLTLLQITCDAVEPGITFGIGIWGIFALFISLEGGRIHRYMPAQSMTAGISYYEGLLMLYGWTPVNEWRGTDRRKAINIPDLVLGASAFSTEVLGEYQVLIPMPEGNYRAKVSMLRCTWSRTRWPRRKVIQRAEVDVEPGIPIPGKGENDWDMADTAIESVTVVAQSLPEAVGCVVKSALRDRERYGGTIAWVPQGVQVR